MANKNILLVEPSYKNKYPPLGLMKLAQYHGPQGKCDRVTFIKGEDASAFGTAWDRIYITTLFSFEFSRIAQSIDFALKVANGHADKIFVGGIAASLMPEQFASRASWQGIRFIQGLLTGPPAKALRLDEYSEELYSDDNRGPAIEDLIPDYSILDQINYEYPVRDAYFAYASRGCIRKCTFCGVPKLEGDQRDAESITAVVRNIEARYGPKKDLILMDNNVVASPRFREIIAEIRDLGFVPDAKLSIGRVPVQRRVTSIRALTRASCARIRSICETLGGRAQFREYQREFKKLSSSERAELLGLISAVDPRELPAQVRLATTSRVRSIMKHYRPLAKNEEAEICAKQRVMRKQEDPSIVVPDDERVEDAGLNYEEAPTPAVSKTAHQKMVMAIA